MRPKRSTAESRKDVQLFRKMNFRNSKHEFYGIPIMAANMDGVATIEMAKKLATYGIFTCLNKTIPTMELVNYFDTDSKSTINYTAMTIGAAPKDEEKFFSENIHALKMNYVEQKKNPNKKNGINSKNNQKEQKS